MLACCIFWLFKRIPSLRTRRKRGRGKGARTREKNGGLSPSFSPEFSLPLPPPLPPPLPCLHLLRRLTNTFSFSLTKIGLFFSLPLFFVCCFGGKGVKSFTRVQNVNPQPHPLPCTSPPPPHKILGNTVVNVYTGIMTFVFVRH